MRDHKHDFWPEENPIIGTWNILNRPTWGDAKKYFDTIEHNLNTAIYYSAAAINYLLNTEYKGGECEGTTGGDGPIAGEIPSEVPVDVTEQMWLTRFFSVGGVISSLLALGLVSIFEKLKSGAPIHLPGVGRVPGIPA